MTPKILIKRAALNATVQHLESRGRLSGLSGSEAAHFVSQRIYQILHSLDINNAIKENKPISVFAGCFILLSPPFIITKSKIVMIEVFPYVMLQELYGDKSKFVSIDDGKTFTGLGKLRPYPPELNWPTSSPLRPVT